MKVVLYLVVINTFPKDSLDDSYKYIGISDKGREYTVFTRKHFHLNDTIFIKNPFKY